MGVEERVLVDLGPGFTYRSLAWSPDGAYIAFADQHGVHEVNVANGQSRLVFGLGTNIVSADRLAYAPDGSMLAVGYQRSLSRSM
jgi:hypothetical protein